MQSMQEFIDNALSFWRQKRDDSLAKYGLSVEAVYAQGNFEELPPECLMDICYVDAYASMKAVVTSSESK